MKLIVLSPVFLIAIVPCDGKIDCLNRYSSQEENALYDLFYQILEKQISNGPHSGAWKDQGVYADLPGDLTAHEREFQGSSYVYSTALNVITLFNLNGYDTREGKEAIDRGLRYNLNHAVYEDNKTFWQGGVFFSSSIKEVARWKSRAYTTAVVLEAK